MRLYNSYANSESPSITMMSNVIAYSQSDNEKMINYARIVEDRYKVRDTNSAYHFSEEGYKFFASSYSNISDSNAYRFIKSMLPIYRRMGEDGAVKGANRALHFMYLYTNDNYDLIDEYFTPRTLSRFLKAKNDPKESVRYLNYITNIHQYNQIINRKDYNIDCPIMMRWGNNNEMILQKADELVDMLNEKIANNKKIKRTVT